MLALMTISFLCQMPAIARYTSLVVDAREVDLVRSMSPRIYSESGRELYGSVPPGASEKVMNKQSFLYAFSLEEALKEDNDRIGANPLILQAVGGKLGDVYISDASAERVITEDRTALFFKNQNVIVLVAKPDVGDRPSDLGGPSESNTVSALKERLASLRARRQGISDGSITAGIPPVDRPFDESALPGQIPSTGARVVVTRPGDSANGAIAKSSAPGSEDLGGDIQLASVIKIRGQKILLQRLDSASQVRLNSKFRVYRSILKNSSIGWIKIIRAEGKDLEGRILEGDDSIKVGDYIDLSEENTIKSYLENFN
ncbi:MAG: hypothetical protein CVV64_08795 [Candidatus Wallbacteria bacterium HGW-Wallbacteria-1]|uniref:Uncharacterized protein n=1 Tax=Candidatus Wallbacteria bacterium HGW-Wallbacteria-1 TaxID=2013854 RepID=A0A2N1PQ29_9BACT|nr:MAG: hypothetical protein CVV64_08795 [Candidatus Wallbacteria bacterium HGW-Wallbacteria-1]